MECKNSLSKEGREDKILDFLDHVHDDIHNLAISVMDKLREMETKIEEMKSYNSSLRRPSSFTNSIEQWKNLELKKVYEEMKLKFDRLDELERQIGVLPEGAHPDEILPRAATWIKERMNWQAEVNQLREKIKEQELIIYGLEEGADEWKLKCSDLQKDAQTLTQIEQERPKIVCLCGSTRFMEAFQQANLNETIKGNIVLSVGCNTKSDADLFGHYSDSEMNALKERLDELHKRKIDLCDEVFVLNVGGYIGNSTRSEIEYAIAHNKSVRYLEPNE